MFALAACKGASGPYSDSQFVDPAEIQMVSHARRKVMKVKRMMTPNSGHRDRRLVRSYATNRPGAADQARTSSKRRATIPPVPLLASTSPMPTYCSSITAAADSAHKATATGKLAWNMAARPVAPGIEKNVRGDG